MVTLRTVAARAGVSRGTVSNVLNHPELVSAQRRRRVEEAMLSLGFVRNESARQLRTGVSTLMGLSLLDTWNPFFNEVTRGIEDSVYSAGLNLSVSTSALDRERERRNLELFEQRRVRGLFVVPTNEDTLGQLVRMRKRGVTCVLVDQSPDGYELPSVSVDDIAGGRAAGHHLLELGRSRILFAGNPAVHAHAAKRMAGLQEAMQGVTEVGLIVTTSVDIHSGLAAGEQVIALPRRERPDAIVCANDLVAIGVLQVFAREGVDVPGEIALVGYDDIDFASQVAVPLTTVRQPAYQMGVDAARLILRDIEEGSPGEVLSIVYVPELVVRASTVGGAAAPVQGH